MINLNEALEEFKKQFEKAEYKEQSKTVKELIELMIEFIAIESYGVQADLTEAQKEIISEYTTDQIADKLHMYIDADFRKQYLKEEMLNAV